MRSIRIAGLFMATVALVILYLPVFVALIFSFNSAPRGMVWRGFTTRWYGELWTDARLMHALANSLQIVSLVGIISFLLGLGWAYVVVVADRSVSNTLGVILIFPIVAPDLVLAISQAVFYSAIGMPKGVLAISMSQAGFGASYVALFVIARLSVVDFPGYLRASYSLGAGPLRALITLFLPLALPAAVAGVAGVAALSLQDFLYSFFCGGVGSTTLSVLLYSSVRFGVRPIINVMYAILLLGSFILFCLSSNMAEGVKK